jgi:hypothetical protein
MYVCSYNVCTYNVRYYLSQYWVCKEVCTYVVAVMYVRVLLLFTLRWCLWPALCQYVISVWTNIGDVCRYEHIIRDVCCVYTYVCMCVILLMYVLIMYLLIVAMHVIMCKITILHVCMYFLMWGMDMRCVYTSICMNINVRT